VLSEFRLSAKVAAALIADARTKPNMECCGLLAGRNNTSEEILPANNSLNSPTAYEIAPAELFSLFRTMRTRALNLTGIYHSHPAGENRPSKTDIALAYYPSTPYIIISPLENAPKPIRAFMIVEGVVSELGIAIF
jgi:desampylase